MSTDADIIDHETGEVLSAPKGALQMRPPKSFSETMMTGAGVRQLSGLSHEDFASRLTEMKLGKERMREVQRSLLDKDVDYGVIPGTKKNTLFKSGAEKLAEFFQFATSYEITRTIGDGTTTPTIHYSIKCFVHLGSTDGPIIHAGAGTANSWEAKYRYRNAGRLCPDCGKDTIIKGRTEYGGGWLCFSKKGGCGGKWKDGDQAIEGQEVGKIDNPDPYDLDNTFLKMGKKRAYIDGIIGATATSELFTQDIGDTGGGDHGDAYTHSEGGREYGGEPAKSSRATASSKPPAGAAESSGQKTGDARVDAMIDAFSKATSAKGLEKLGETFGKWPAEVKAMLKEPFNKRFSELVDSEEGRT